MTWQQMVPFLVALAIGLLLGLERERSHGGIAAAGSRSFALVALLGAVAAGLGPAALAAGLAGLGVLVAVAYLRTSDADPGTTTEIAVLLGYLLGALAYSRPALAVGLAVVTTVLLVSKARIHRFVREVVSEVELEDAIKFFVVAFVILPLLPDRDLGPYGVLNPAKVWLLVVLITGIGWLGYIGVRALGPARGLLVTGLAGGFVSASATTASMGRLSRTDVGVRAPLASALVASIGTFVQLLIVIGLVDVEVLSRLWPPVLAGALTLTGVAVIVAHGSSRGAPAGPPQPVSRPFAIRPALVLAALLTSALIVARWGAAQFGADGAVAAAGAAGLADAHAGAVAGASLAAKGDITVETAVLAVSAAMGSNLLVKFLLAGVAGGRRFASGFVAGMALPALVYGAVLTAMIVLG
ncbi:MAG: MgtC/SapB family protein [Mycobacterium sp.]|nr:MgtC/SapB family protein [Mycobacterium sp.]